MIAFVTARSTRTAERSALGSVASTANNMEDEVLGFRVGAERGEVHIVIAGVEPRDPDSDTTWLQARAVLALDAPTYLRIETALSLALSDLVRLKELLDKVCRPSIGSLVRRVAWDTKDEDISLEIAVDDGSGTLSGRLLLSGGAVGDGEFEMEELRVTSDELLATRDGVADVLRVLERYSGDDPAAS